MSESDSDSELLQRYVEGHSGAAFRELLERRLGMVYSVALRTLDLDAAAAEEVAQEVFLLLVRKARELRTHPSLTAWLFTSTRRIAGHHQRSEYRRRIREQKAIDMSHQLLGDGPSPDWTAIRPVIDQAIAELDDTDKQAVLWRFFEKQGYAWIGRELGLSEEAARKRVTRALDGLHGALSKRGITSTATAIGLALEVHAVAAVPVQLSGRILGSIAMTGAFVPPVATTVVVASGWWSQFAGYKPGLGLAGLVAVGALAIRAWQPSPHFSSSLPTSGQESGGAIQASAGSEGSLARLQAAVQARAQKSAEDLDEARRRLREVLTSPQRAEQYPPTRLVGVLALFGSEVKEAVPILLESIRVEDSETQTWALSGLGYALGLWTGEDVDGSRSRAMAEIRPVLGDLLSDADRPEMIRLLALGGLCPVKVYRSDQPKSPPHYDLDSLALVERTLHSTPRKADPFRFTIVDRMVGFGSMDAEIEQVIRRMIPMLGASSEEDRILAAYAVAMSPIEKPASAISTLLGAVRDPSYYNRSRAATGLGALGTNVIEAVPILLEYARSVASSTSGEREIALTAACRIQPELRASYPEIDQRLKNEDAARAAMKTQPVVQPFRSVILRAAAEGDDQLKRSLPILRGGGHDLTSEQVQKNREFREMLLAKLAEEMQSGTDEEKAFLKHISDLVQTTTISSDGDAPVEAKPLDMRNLTLSARVVLTDEQNSKEKDLERVLEQFESEKIRSGVYPVATATSLAALSKCLEEIDPEFRNAWRKSVLKEYPWLDRMMPK